jgi:hypothetical protein
MLIFSTNTTITGLDNLVKAAGPSANIGIARALNRTGTVVKNGYLREVRKVLGIRGHPAVTTAARARATKSEKKFKNPMLQAMNRRTSVRRANTERLEYSLAGFGEGLDLLFYQARETPSGLNVFWLGSRKVVPKTFYLGGRFPSRRGGFGPKRGMSAERIGTGPKALRFSPKGPGIPEGMVAKGPAAHWENQARARLGPRIAHELTAILQGHAPGARK